MSSLSLLVLVAVFAAASATAVAPAAASLAEVTTKAKAKAATAAAAPAAAPVAAASLAEVQYPVNLTEAIVRNIQKEHDPFDSMPTGPSRTFHMPLNQTDSNMQFSKRIRRNILHMSLDEQSEYFMSCRLLKQEPHLPPFGHNTSLDVSTTGVQLKWNTWDWLAFKHQLTSTKHVEVANGDLFLPWHRMWLLYYEEQFQRVSGNANMTQPYWDYSNRYEAMKIFTDPMFGGNGTGPTHQVKNGQFSNWTQKVAQGSTVYQLAAGRLTREIGISNTRWIPNDGRGAYVSSFGLNIDYHTDSGFNSQNITPEQKQAGTLPSGCDVMAALNTKLAFGASKKCNPSMAFGIFFLHRLAHRFIGGDLQTVSGNDPILLILHTFTDKLWMMWQKAHVHGLYVHGEEIPDPPNVTQNTYGYPQGAMNTTLYWLGGTPREMLQWEDLDYQYEWDDTIDMMYYKWVKFGGGVGKQKQCMAWNQQIGMRNFTKAGCHLTV